MGLLGEFYMLKHFINFPDCSNYRSSKTQNLHSHFWVESRTVLQPTDWERNVEQGFVDLVWDLCKKILRSLNPDLDLSVDVHWHNGNEV